MDRSPNQLDDLTDVTLVERYHIKGKLGQGGMGSIYTAHDGVLNRDVAIKTVARNNLNDTEMVRFHREGKAASLVRHPNVIQMLDFGVLESGQPFIVMEWIKGLSITSLLADRGPQSPLFTLKIIEQIADGMSAVHKVGIIHRDLKTSNIMIVDLDSTPLVRIVDFGIAKTLTDESQKLTKAGQIFGSPHYMSPEQIRGEDVDQRSDIYSLGCIAVEMLTGHTLFEGETVMEVATKHLTEPVPRLWETTDKTFPMELERLVAHMVAKDPADRFQTMDEVIGYGKEVQAVLQELLEEEQAAAKAAGKEVMTETQIFKKQKLDMRIIVTGLLVATGVLIGSLYTIVTPMMNKKVEQIPEKIEKGKRQRSLDRAKYSFEVLDTLESSADVGGFAIDHSGNATSILRKKIKSGREVHNLVLIESKIVPSDVKMIAQLNPRKLNVESCVGITDGTIKELCQVSNIRALDISNCKGITPKGIAQLSALPKLTTLSFENCDFTDEHLKAMSKIQTLTNVYMANNKNITINGIKYLGDKMLPLAVHVDQPSVYLLSKEKQLQLNKEHNIVLLHPQTLGEDLPTKYAKKVGLDHFVEINQESELELEPINPRDPRIERLLDRRNLE